MNFLETFVNNIVPKEYRQQFKEGIRQGKKDFIQATNNIVSNTISGVQDAVNYFQSGGLEEGLNKAWNYIQEQTPEAQKYIMENPVELGLTLAMFIPGIGGVAAKIARPMVAAYKAGGMTRAAGIINNIAKTAPKAKNAMTAAKGTSVIPYYSNIGKDVRSLDKFIQYINNAGKANGSTAQYINGLKQAAGGTENIIRGLIADGAKIGKKDLSRVNKFIGQLGDLLKNSPANVLFTNGAINGVNTGLTLFDMWQAFEEGGDTLIPKSGANTGRLLGTFLGKNPLTKIVYSSLGYLGGAGIGGLAQAGLQKLGIIEDDKDYKTGLAIRNLGQYVPDEYLQGISGRKYHRVGDKIYDYATGKPVNVREALYDADQYNISQKQQAKDMRDAAADRVQGLINLRDMGYNISNDEIQQAYTDAENAQNAYDSIFSSNYISNLGQGNYDPNGDLVQQYYQQNVLPNQQQQAQNQQLEQANLLADYREVFNKVANDTYADVDAYYNNPENLAIEYYQNQVNAATFNAPSLTPEQFARIQKAKTMYELGPQIRDRALETMRQFSESGYKSGMLNYYNRENQRKIMADYETQRKNLAAEQQKQAQLRETQRHNLSTEGINAYRARQYGNYVDVARQNAATNYNKMLINQFDAETRRRAEQRQQSNQPFVQANLMGSSISGAVAGGMGLTPDQFLNTNQSVLQNVFPGAFQGQQQQGQLQSWNLPPEK